MKKKVHPNLRARWDKWHINNPFGRSLVLYYVVINPSSMYSPPPPPNHNDNPTLTLKLPYANPKTLLHAGPTCAAIEAEISPDVDPTKVRDGVCDEGMMPFEHGFFKKKKK